MRSVAVLLPVILALMVSPGLAGDDQLKVFISVDMEGICGVVHEDQTSSSGKDYGRARLWMTEETNAAILGAILAGATEVVVNDSHGGMRNILIEKLDPRADLISGSPKPLSMMQGIDATFNMNPLVLLPFVTIFVLAFLKVNVLGSMLASVVVIIFALFGWFIEKEDDSLICAN